ncbi:hypothetical protein GOP47_0022306 [Adiantum capillus-veneris]|uniref:AAA+ ATPase domain-containing protein n=1 Tax=Adiantum capillus-veneris TaxID=13818 RepID=A0A9D4Z6Z3_ADICA|nr:hypothetical protein GOP47_0021993 [Adiantum capillus-veneris]KAI5063759.1 hypothetical protein GOP47_0022306 [Adiantum capillus-veneris]
MDSTQKLLSALALGVGLGFGLATAGTKSFNGWTSDSLSDQVLENELLALVADCGEGSVTFDRFPYFLNEETKVLLTNAAYVHLKQTQLGKFTRKLSPASRAVLLSGPARTEQYHKLLVSALAHFFQAKLLILDISDFSSKMQMKYANSKYLTELSLSKDSTYGAVRCMNGFFGKNSVAFPNGIRFVQAFLKEDGSTKSSVVEDKKLVSALYRALSRLSEDGPIILYLYDCMKLVNGSSETVTLLRNMFMKLAGPVFVLSSRFLKEPCNEQVSAYCDENVAALFPYKINIKPPTDNDKLVSWKSQLEKDMKVMKAHGFRNRLVEILNSNNVKCEDLDSLCFKGVSVGNLIEEIVVAAISHHLMNTDKPQICQGRLIISSKSLAHGLSLFQAGGLKTKDPKLQADPNSKHLQIAPESSKNKSDSALKVVGEGKVPKSDASKKSGSDGPKNDALNKKADTDGHNYDPSKEGDTSATKGGAIRDGPTSPTPAKEIVVDNEFEKRIRPDIIPAGEIGVSFEDIGALDDVKEALQEVVMLPLQRSDLFSRGGLIKPCKGILLFGPPGTGKTMLAKAVAREAGASFINVSMSTITSKWFGEDEKNVRALFTLASKVAPTILFIDEVDSMLGQRSRTGEHETMRKIKNEFMAHWDGLRSKGGERILVLAATNRPFDLDDAIIRRFERRIMVDLPNKENREKILNAILSKEAVSDDLDTAELANMTEGYSGSDLKNLCTVAAYRPIRELLKKEMKNGNASIVSKIPSASHISEDSNSAEATETKVLEPMLRPLNMEDLKQAKSQVSSSYAAEGVGMAELRAWNDMFGEGGSRKKQQLTYFL